MDDISKLLNDKGFRQASYAFVLIELIGGFCIAMLTSPNDIIQFLRIMAGGMMFLAPFVLIIIVIVALFKHKNTPRQKGMRKSKKR